MKKMIIKLIETDNFSNNQISKKIVHFYLLYKRV